MLPRSVRRFVILAAIPALATLGGCQTQCGRDEPGCNELANKHEYSVLEAVQADLSERRHDRSYLIFPKAADSDLTVIAFPRAGIETGYVVLFANSETPPRDKSMPDEDFVVTLETLAAVKTKADLSPEVERFIREMATHLRSGAGQ